MQAKAMPCDQTLQGEPNRVAMIIVGRVLSHASLKLMFAVIVGRRLPAYSMGTTNKCVDTDKRWGLHIAFCTRMVALAIYMNDCFGVRIVLGQYHSSIQYVLFTYPDSALAIRSQVSNCCYCTRSILSLILRHFLIVHFSSGLRRLLFCHFY